MDAVMLVPPPPVPKGPPCTVGLLMERLPEAERDALAEMLADPVWTGVDIAAEIVMRGYTRIQGGTVSRHRRGACGCP